MTARTRPFPDLNLKGLASRGVKEHLPLAEGLRLDAQTERRRDMRPRGRHRQDADNVHRGA